MPLPSKISLQFDKIRLPFEICQEDISFAAAGSDPVFGDFAPDEFSAFARFKVCKSLPMVVGPESISGQIFGIHPGVIARSFESLRYKQLNKQHQLKMFGASQNAFCGCILQVAFPESPEGGWTVPASVEEAPSISALGTLFKQEDFVGRMMGEHLGSKKRWSVSMEMYYLSREVGVYDPSTRECFDRGSIPTKLRGYINESNDGRIEIRKSARKPPLVLALGGVTGRIWFSGTGFTTMPAEETAELESIAAERREGMVVCNVAAAPTWMPGMQATWTAMEGGYGRGTVLDIFDNGLHGSWGSRLRATAENPVLLLKLPDGRRVLRNASWVQRKC